MVKHCVIYKLNDIIKSNVEKYPETEVFYKYLKDKDVMLKKWN